MLGSPNLPKVKVSVTTIVKEAKPTGRVVSVTLTEEDFNRVWVAAEFNHETVSEWISGLVNTALQP